MITRRCRWRRRPGSTLKRHDPEPCLHFHLAEAALRTRHAMVRPEDGDPLTLRPARGVPQHTADARSASQPVLDPSRGSTGRRLRDPGATPRRRCKAPPGRRRLPLRHLPQPQHGSRSHRTVRVDGLRRAARPNPARQPRPAWPDPSHRAVTHGGWAKHQPEPGYYVHRSPIGYVYLVTNQGTLALGRTEFSDTVWQASKPKPAASPA